MLFERKVINTAASDNTEGNLQAYKIQSQDILQVRNLQNLKLIVSDIGNGAAGPSSSTDLQGQNYTVEDDGNVTLPVLGRVAVAGLTKLEATDKIEALYRKTVIKDPIIEVKLVNLTVTILGEVRSPGNYPLLKDRTTLVEMIGRAGGITDKANEKRVKIIRGGVLNPQEYEIDLSDMSSMSNPAMILRNQDIVYIGQNKRAIRNDKLQNFSTIVQPALLLINTALLIFTLTKN
ncbi:polysaccharide biosynthesis/export family protein [Mucilaginibacter glaciei]|uniref:Polysaccharide biosynthesis/export family protein n=1 Tax=Mucilaginibacter glaciei TaxID=2772109 RepID=A0A926S4M0_9SPHI|nr:polysaccharide biosynthesis/export family protein [Mucilaginibacter glaciei]MBD1395409.1 polysaccharide biosynthesis/export family protein [Mucilaginibacter glaciei]